MDSSQNLGDELMLNDDPFISGATHPSQDDSLFKEFYEDNTRFNEDEDILECENQPSRFEGLEDIEREQSSCFGFDLLGCSDNFGLNEFRDFPFDENDSLTILEPIGAVETNHSQATPANDAQSERIELQKARVEMTRSERNIHNVDKVSIPSKESTLSNNDAILEKIGIQQKGSTTVISKMAPLPIKKKTLYPVKIRKILPQNNRKTASKAFSPYALSPIGTKLPAPIKDNGVLSNKQTAENHEQILFKRSKPLIAYVPKDYCSNHIRCCLCSLSFSSQLALEFHEVEKHAGFFAYECVFCNGLWSEIREISKHIVAFHDKEHIPLLDSTIFGNGDDTERGRKNSQRRITGMIWSFLSNHLAHSGEISGAAAKNEFVRQQAKKIFHPTGGCSNDVSARTLLDESAFTNVQLDESASINDLLIQQYIYGPSIRRISIEDVPIGQVIKRCNTDPRKILGNIPLREAIAKYGSAKNVQNAINAYDQSQAETLDINSEHSVISDVSLADVSVPDKFATLRQNEADIRNHPITARPQNEHLLQAPVRETLQPRVPVKQFSVNVASYSVPPQGIIMANGTVRNTSSTRSDIAPAASRTSTPLKMVAPTSSYRSNTAAVQVGLSRSARPTHSNVPLLANKIITLKPAPNFISSKTAVVVAKPFSTITYRPQFVQKAAFVQQKSTKNGGTVVTKRFLGNVYMSNASRKTYILADKQKGIKPNAVKNLTDSNKMNDIEMPPVLEHYAARDHLKRSATLV